jgi:hypothetical protein
LRNRFVVILTRTLRVDAIDPAPARRYWREGIEREVRAVPQLELPATEDGRVGWLAAPPATLQNAVVSAPPQRSPGALR